MISSYMCSNKTPFITFTNYLHYFILRMFVYLIVLFFTCRKRPQSKELRTIVNKGKEVASEKLEMTPLFTDTTCNREGGTSTWEAMYNILEEEAPRIMETKITVDGRDSSNTSMLETACSFFHHIAT